MINGIMDGEWDGEKRKKETRISIRQQCVLVSHPLGAYSKVDGADGADGADT